jgi:hypothetical protein
MTAQGTARAGKQGSRSGKEEARGCTPDDRGTSSAQINDEERGLESPQPKHEAVLTQAAPSEGPEPSPEPWIPDDNLVVQLRYSHGGSNFLVQRIGSMNTYRGFQSKGDRHTTPYQYHRYESPLKLEAPCPFELSFSTKFRVDGVDGAPHPDPSMGWELYVQFALKTSGGKLSPNSYYDYDANPHYNGLPNNPLITRLSNPVRITVEESGTLSIKIKMTDHLSAKSVELNETIEIKCLPGNV